MRTIEIDDAESRFDELLTEVENGESIILTRNGQPVTRFIPEDRVKEDVAAAIEEGRK
ncbi:MAG: type II toxin-antitoxin system prevent-host-death family antitoxin [Chloroflexia bacterium]|nr:type II toxin-antitoxin system prevent-host-death family antitoxin [Chloroflexia bacterium]